MFRGSFQTRTDEKGRLKVPADFKRELEERFSGARFFITSKTGKTAEIYPMEVWEGIERKVMELPRTNVHRQRFLNATNYYGQVVEMDAQGRLLLPALLREKANLKGEVSVVGNLDYLEVHNYEDFTKQIEEHPFTDEDANALSELGI